MNRFSDKVHVECKIVEDDLEHIGVVREFYDEDDDCLVDDLWVDPDSIVQLPKKDIEINHDGTITLPYRLAIEKGLA
jgi:hypothetical protein